MVGAAKFLCDIGGSASVRGGPGHNRVIWKNPSRAAFVPLQEPVAVLAILCSPHTNAGMKQYECGRTQPLFRAGHGCGITCVSKPKGLRLILIIMKHKCIIITTKQTNLKKL
jgi:hypothetical protein